MIIDAEEDRTDDPDFWEEDDGGPGGGPCECNGSGVIVTCIDDLCRGAGTCMHGDGEKLCPCGRDPG